ncbi:MAG: GNAT family N-acetyltransferase [Myxococcota bacterium]|nr:GNAT family N-acetyltransferase [Myxococcota bacterium]
MRIQRAEDAVRYRASFAGAYQDIFSEPPYNERFFPSEAQAALHRYVQTQEHITILAVRGRSRVVGFGIGVPALSKPDIARDLHGLLPVQHSFYLAELGVLEGHRGKGIGKSLISHRMQAIDANRYTHAVLRVSAVKNATYDMYMAMGFDDIGVYTEVHSRRIDGRVSTDRRLFLSKLLEGPPRSAQGAPEDLD